MNKYTNFLKLSHTDGGSNSSDGSSNWWLGNIKTVPNQAKVGPSRNKTVKQ